MDNFLTNFVVSLLAYVFLYFNVPYWAGSELKDSMKNGVFAKIYYIASTPGHAIYKGITEVVDRHKDEKITFIERILRGGAELGIYLVFIELARKIYDIALEDFVYPEMSDIAFKIDSSYAFYQDIIVFKEALALTISEGDSFIAGLGGTLAFMLFYVVSTLMYFAFIYGLLEFKMKELNLARFLPEIGVPQDAEFRSPFWVFAKIYNEVLEFLNKASIPEYFARIQYLIPTLIFVAFKSFKDSTAGNIYDKEELIANIIDEMNIFGVMFSFFISFAWITICRLICWIIYRKSSEAQQTRYRTSSRNGYQYVYNTKKKRVDFAYSKGHCEYNLHELHLEDI